MTEFSRQPSRKTAGFHEVGMDIGSQGHGLLDPQVQVSTLTLQYDTYFSLIVPSTSDPG